MIKVDIRDNSQEAFDKAMKIFKKLCQNDGFMVELNERKYYKKPSEINHERDRRIKNERKRNKGDN